MSLWMLVKLVAGLAVLALVVFTVLLVRHVRSEPLGGIFAGLVPVAIVAAPMAELPEPSAGLPEIDPGAKIFEKARELIAIGDLPGARDKLRTVVSIYPRSKAAPEARRIVGEMNLDEILSPASMDGKTVYKVARGDSYLGIAAKNDTTLDLIVHLNGLLDLRSLQPGDELVLMPLDFRFVIEPARKTLGIWQEGRFIAEYPLLSATGAPAGERKTTVSGKTGFLGDKRFPPSLPGYRGSLKMLTLKGLPLAISAAAPPEPGDADDTPAAGFFLAPEDAEELALLTRPGNEVEIRNTAR